MRFSALDERKTIEEKRFYRSSRWTRASRLHRIREPLCRYCAEHGRIRKGELVHHEPDLRIIVQRNLNPFDDRYLVTLCNDCHMAELRTHSKFTKGKGVLIP